MWIRSGANFLVGSTLVLSVLCGLAAIAPGAADTLTQLISREDPAFIAKAARMNIGKDGNVYLSNNIQASAYVMRIGRDGSGKFGSQVTYALSNATANSSGIVAGGHQHFNHSLNIYDRTLTRTGSVNDFLNNDTVGYDAPAYVETGESGDFYGIDQHRNRVVRISPDAKIVTTYPVRADGEPDWKTTGEFRVCEKTQSFYWETGSTIRCVGFDGKTKWSVPAIVGGNVWDGYFGGFDVDPAGNLYTINGTDPTVSIFTPDGKPSGKITLQMADSLPSPTDRITDLQVFGSDIVIKRADPVELFSVYDMSTGAKKRTVNGAVERFSVDYPGTVWTAGQSAPIAIKLDSGSLTANPTWHVWLRPFNMPAYRELPVTNGAITVPANAAGLYQFKVSAGVAGSNSEYLVQNIVEIRPPGARGSATVMTPASRRYYGRGESIPVTVQLRSLPADAPKSVPVSLVDSSGTIASETLTPTSPSAPITFTIGKDFTSHLAPGSYRIVASVPGFTCMGQPIEIGPGASALSPFRNISYGDYGATFPSSSFWEAPETVQAHMERVAKLGKNMFVDRLGSGLGGAVQWPNTPDGQGVLTNVTARETASPIAVAPDKVQIESPFMQMVAGYSAAGYREMAILMGMDAGLPIGTLWDPRKPETVKPIITNITKGMLTYPAFIGWDWAANWWPSKFGADAAATPEQRAAYDAALKVATATGKWDPVLDEVSNVWMNYIPNATQDFASTLHAIAPGLLSDDPGPYRSVDVYPPVSFKYADEVDLHYQSEQIQPPLTMPHDVDFQKRPGKPAWAHPELWNDNGTGDQVLTTSFELMMRGADGIGQSGIVPYMPRQPEDPRQSYFGTVSVYRALGKITSDYGPWLTNLHKADSIAIICSPRMFRIDNWGGVGGKHFTRLYEAYLSCLYAHRPASFVFLDDMTPATLKSYRAALLVDQEVEMEPQLKTYLDQAKAAGVSIFYDANCRPELMTGYSKIGYAFAKVDADPNVWQDDSAYPRLTGYFHDGAAAITSALGSIISPLANTDKPDILMTQLTSGDGKYLFVVNNTLPPLEPGIMWRTDNYITTRLPVTANLHINIPGKTIYDVFASRMLPSSGDVSSDMRTLPGRLYAILPSPIARVALRGPKAVQPGQTFAWAASVQGPGGSIVNSAIPIRVQLLAASSANQAPLYDIATVANLPAAQGSIIVPANIDAKSLSLVVTELISGKTARLTIPVTSGGTAARLAGFTRTYPGAAPASATAFSTSESASQPVESAFGLHFRDLAVAKSGASVLATLMNLDTNTCVLNASSGAPEVRTKIGNWFTYSPQFAGDGFAVVGYDNQSPYGYYLYLTDRAGKPVHRFANYGLPKRMLGWAFPNLSENLPAAFAVPSDGTWVASSGDLGIAVWTAEGKLLWQQDGRERRQAVPIFAAGSGLLIVPVGADATAYNARTGEKQWTINLAPNGQIVAGIASADGRTVAIRATSLGGRVWILRDGKLIDTIYSAADAMALTPDAKQIAITINKELRWYDIDAGLKWSYTADDILHNPRISPSGDQIAVCSELGSLYVFSSDGTPKINGGDLGALASPSWLPNGKLIAVTWEGKMVRVDSGGFQTTAVGPADDANAARSIDATDSTPTSAITGWTNSETTPLPITPNLIKDTGAKIEFCNTDRAGEAQNDVKLLYDGAADPPAKPWLTWSWINGIDSGWSAGTSIRFDTWRTQLHLTGISFYEDPAHPESWLRDMVLQYWDPETEAWVNGASLLSNSAVHSHVLPHPLDASRFRLVTSGGGQWPAGNIRLGEVVLHGTTAGGSHPDVVAKRPIAVLFDEKESDISNLAGAKTNWKFNYTDSYSGGKCIEVEADKQVVPNYDPKFGHSLPNWDFDIEENPGPGQYRYLQFAWKAGSPSTTAMSLWIGNAWPGGGPEAVVGKSPWKGEGITASQQLGTVPPQKWQVVTLDLWKGFGKPAHIYAMGLAATGGSALFDNIVLLRNPPKP